MESAASALSLVVRDSDPSPSILIQSNAEMDFAQEQTEHDRRGTQPYLSRDLRASSVAPFIMFRNLEL